MPFERILMIVVIKLVAPKIDEAPAKCRERIAKSTDGPMWAMFLAKGGYTVHPVPTPLSASIDSKSDREGRSSHRLRLFRRVNAISGIPSIRGSNQFPKPPINTGITKKKIIKNACAVTIVL